MNTVRGLITPPVALSAIVVVAVIAGGLWWFIRTTPVTSPSATDTTVEGFTATPTSGPAPLTVSFSSSYGEIAGLPTGYDIDFGDDQSRGVHCDESAADIHGMCKTPVVIEHTYTTAGVYTATLNTFAGASLRTSWHNTGTIDSITITVGAAPPPVSVSGMSKYTDTDFGFSFWYPSNWSVVKLPMASTDKAGNFVTERLMVRDGENVEIDIDKVHSDQLTYNVNPGPCGYCGAVKYYFDAGLHAWMKVYPEGLNGAPGATPEQEVAAKVGKPADISNNTMGGLHMFSTEQKENAVIIPLSARNFLFVYGVTYTEQCGPACGDPSVKGDAYFLARTIAATDPAVATPLGLSAQTTTIKAEQAAYAGL